MQPLVEEKIGIGRDRFPGRESAGRSAIELLFFLIVNIVPRGPGAGFAVVAKQLFELLEQIGLGTEVAERLGAALRLLHHLATHLGAVVAVERIAFDKGCGDLLAAEDVLERPLHRCRAGARRARDRYDGMAA